MTHDVFLCYDDRDADSAREVCRLFEDNGVSCWLRSRDRSLNGPGEEIFKAIDDAKAFVLIFSKNSDSDEVVREVNEAFGAKTKIMILNLDESSIYGKMEFYLKDQYSLPLFPNLNDQLERLVMDTSYVVSRPYSKIRVPSQTKKHFRKFEPKYYRRLRYVKIAVPVVIVMILIVWFVVLPSGFHTTDDGVFSMNITNIDVKNLNGKYVYTVLGDAYNMPENSDRYIMQLKFYDKDKKQVYEVNSTCDEFKGSVIATFNRNNDNITDVGFRVVDFDDNVICTQNYSLG